MLKAPAKRSLLLKSKCKIDTVLYMKKKSLEEKLIEEIKDI